MNRLVRRDLARGPHRLRKARRVRFSASLPFARVLLSLLLSTILPGVTDAAGVLSVRHWSAPDHTRVVIDVDGPPSHRVRELTGPDRIAVDISGSRFADAVERLEIGDGLLHRVRINQLPGPTAQVVLDLVGPRRHRVFELEPHGDRPHRIVIDVFRPDGRSGDGAVASDGVVAAPTTRPDLVAKDDGVTVIVIDPGHGGEDPGATRNGLHEKDIVLKVARALERSLTRAKPEIQVHLTRTGDYFLPLRTRYRLAEEKHADLFISLHVNASRKGNASGADVFFLTLGRATDTEARRVAELENASDLVGGAPPESGSDLVSILADLQMKNTLARSSLLAESLLSKLDSARLVKTRRINQAKFVVLQSARVPSVLIEIGFISHRGDRKRMTDSNYLERVATTLKDGIVAYLSRVEAP